MTLTRSVRSHREVAHPVHLARRVVEVVLVRVLEFADAPEHARGDARPEVGAVADLPVARRTRRRPGTAAVFFAPREVSSGEKQRLQAARAGREEVLQNGLRTTSSTMATRITTGNSLNQRNQTWLCVLRSAAEIAASACRTRRDRRPAARRARAWRGTSPRSAPEPAEPQPEAEGDGEHRARGHDAPEELALHDLEALDRDRGPRPSRGRRTAAAGRTARRTRSP